MIMVIIFFILILLMVFFQLLDIRIDKLYRFQKTILYSEVEYINKIKGTRFKIYESLPSYNGMLFSFKSLSHCKPWISREDYLKLKPYIKYAEIKIDTEIAKEKEKK